MESFADLGSGVDRTAIEALRALVPHVIVKLCQPRGAEIEVVGHLSALIGYNTPEVGDPMVAEDRVGHKAHITMIDITIG